MAALVATPNGRIKAQVLVPTGRFTSRTFDTKTQARAWARQTEAARDRGERPTQPSMLTVADHYRPLAEQRASVLSSATVDKNLSHWTRHLEPVFGDRKVVDVRRSDVAAWVAQASKAGVGAPTIKGCIELLSAIFEVAVFDDLIPANPASRVRLPRHSPRVVRWIEPDEVDRIVDQLAEPYALLVALAAGTGLRWGEVAGLKVESVDPFGRSISFESPARGRSTTVRTRCPRGPALRPASPRARAPSLPAERPAPRPRLRARGPPPAASPDDLRVFEASRAGLAPAQVGFHQHLIAHRQLVVDEGVEPRAHVVAADVADHDFSPSSSARSACRARVSRDLTVPTAMPSENAISS